MRVSVRVCVWRRRRGRNLRCSGKEQGNCVPQSAGSFRLTWKHTARVSGSHWKYRTRVVIPGAHSNLISWKLKLMFKGECWKISEVAGGQVGEKRVSW